MRRPLFILNQDGSIREASDREEFLLFMEENNKKEILRDQAFGICEVATYFVGQDRAPKSGKTPQLFETLVHGGVIDGSARLYSTYQEAVAGHKSVLQLVRNNIH